MENSADSINVGDYFKMQPVMAFECILKDDSGIKGRNTFDDSVCWFPSDTDYFKSLSRITKEEADAINDALDLIYPDPFNLLGIR